MKIERAKTTVEVWNVEIGWIDWHDEPGCECLWCQEQELAEEEAEE